MSHSCYINEFRPLAEKDQGRKAIRQHDLSPFIDASCRREPDLESAYPSITALCRKGHFAPHLREGDLVVYMTKQFVYPPTTPSTRRLVAVLRVYKSWRSAEGQPGTSAHNQAAEWYQQEGLPVPRNCMVRGSEPLPLEVTDRYNPDLRKWEAHYWKVAREYGVFHACQPLFCEVNDPPRLTNQQLAEWFATIPNPREMSPLAPEAFAKMLRWLAEQTSGAASSRLLELSNSLSGHDLNCHRTTQPRVDMPDQTPSPQSSIILYQTDDGRTRIQCRFENETIWLTQALIAELFQKDVRTINEHLVNIYDEGELRREATIRKFRIVRIEGARQVTREVEHYNLPAILAVGYRVRSPRGTQFRQWATARLNEYLVKGFTMDDERLKNPPGKGQVDYFDELLERIRDIRASERRVYLRVREILALAADYSPTEPETQAFFQTVQNKLHFAATGKTAPELIAERADATQPNMGLTAWKGGLVRKGDATVAKNYLREEEITELNRIVVMFLDFAEDQARRRKQIFLHHWRARLDDFLRLNERGILPDAGKVSREEADAIAEREYGRFAARRRAQLEAQAEADTLKALEDQVRKLPAKRQPRRPKP